MFGSSNINPDYTFTQAENRLLTSQSSKLISKYVENFGMQKKDKNALLENEEAKKESESTDKARIDKTKEELKETRDGIEEIFGDDEDEETIGITYGSSSAITTSFDALAAAVGASNDKVSKTQLMALLQSLASSSNNTEKASEIAFVKNLIAKFDTLAGDSEYITSFSGVNEPQDYETITLEQVTSPVDVRV